MSKGSGQTGTSTTTQTNATGAAQLPYLQEEWGAAKDLYDNSKTTPYSGPGGSWSATQDPTGYNALNKVATDTLPKVADAAADPYYKATSGAYGVVNSPAYAGLSDIASGTTTGQQKATSSSNSLTGLGGSLTDLSGRSEATGTDYGTQLADVARGTSSALAPATDLLTQQASGYYLNSNPYLDAMYKSSSDATTRAYQTATAPRTEGSYELAGRYGSGSMRNAVSQNQQDLGKTLANQAADIYGKNYSQERQLQSDATKNLGSLAVSGQELTQKGLVSAADTTLAGQKQAGTQLADAGTQYTSAGNLGLGTTKTQQAGLDTLQSGYQAGNTAALQGAALAPTIQSAYTAGPDAQIKATEGLEKQEQDVIDADKKRYEEYNQSPWTNLSYYQKAIGSPVSSTTTSSSPVYGSSLGSTLGGLGSLASGAAALVSSDRRLKKDDRVIGKLGPLPVHTFRYKNERPTDPRHIGFMADEVEQYDPRAVVSTSLGFKAVDYGRALRTAVRGGR